MDASASAGSRLVGVDLGATGLRAGVIDEQGHVVSRAKVATPKDAEQAALAIANVVMQACLEAGIALPGAVGVGVPGPVVGETITAAVNLGWRDVPLAEMVERALGVRAVLINDVNAAALAEQRLGAARGEADMIAVWIGTGVGGGAVLGGEPYLGVDGVAVEIGHMIIDARASAGARTVEDCCSRRAIVGEVERRLSLGEASMIANATPETVARGYRAGDALCVAVVDGALALVGVAAAGACALLGPKVVVVGGALVEAIGPSVAQVVWQAANADAFPPGRVLSVRQSVFGDDAGLIGAALFAAYTMDR
ncbi:MAG: ROK family protein [Phycisphaeraceae bacterium]|nr:ROK family protein [Phycisphaeraceae bacterium]